MALELAVCAAYRVRHSEFLEWSTSDRDKAIWQLLRERRTCPHCLTRSEEWDPDEGGGRRAYVADITQCEGCVVKERAEAQADLSGWRGARVILVPNEHSR